MASDSTTTAAAADLPEALRLADALDRAKDIDYYNHVQDDLARAAAVLRRLHALTASAPAASSAEPAPAHGCCNSWFASLPEGRQAVLRDDKWMLAHAAFEAGRTTPTAPQAGAESYPPEVAIVGKLLELARIVDRAVNDWGESLADGSSTVIFHKSEAEARDAILDYFDCLPENPDPSILESGPIKAARILAATAALRARGAAPSDADLISAAGGDGGEEAASWQFGREELLHLLRSVLESWGATAAPKPPAAPGEQDADLWYLQDTRSYVGNDVLWWAKDARGYTTDISKAHVYTREQAFQHAAMRDCDLPWPKMYIDGKTRPAVDMQYIDHAAAMAHEGGV